MAQGTIKKLGAKPAASSSKPNSGKIRKGARAPKPKNASTADKMRKKMAAGLVTKTEKLLGERAGHLEMIGKGRDKTKGKAAGDKPKGGSRKFG